MAINEIVATVAIVLQMKAGQVVGSATGFFYSNGPSLFLVTNQHVVYDEKAHVKPDTLRLPLHTDARDLTKRSDLDIPLYSNGFPVWKGHPTLQDADVALIKLDRAAVTAKYHINSWSKDDFLPKDIPLRPGEDLFVMGYPLGFYDEYFNLPVFRNATLASSFGIPFRNQPYFLTDANLHPGMSGSPVITKPKTAWMTEGGGTTFLKHAAYYLIGVHSGVVDPRSTGGVSLGLGSAWYASLVQEIAESFDRAAASDARVPLIIEPTAGRPASSNSSVVEVYYATDRGVSSSQPLDYGSGRGDALSFGRFDVSVPKDHRLAHVERPSWWRFEFVEEPDKHFVVVGRKPESEDQFYADVSAAVTTSAKKEAFVFIHGFNVAFEEAVYRTAQLAYDLEFSGPAILYSWPSNSKILDYVADLNNSDWTVPHLKSFLESIARRAHATTVHLIAHSMGNRALANALAQIADDPANPPRPHFRQVILAAADIDADLFKSLAGSMKSTADRITLYSSGNDRALRISKSLNGGYSRAGDTGGSMVVIPGVDTIDASAVDTDLLGHSYYGDNKSILTDRFVLLSEGKPPGERFGLTEIRISRGSYWRFRP